MSIKTWLWNLMNPGKATRIEMDMCGGNEPGVDLYYRMLAFESCVRLVGNLVSKCEFRTLSRGKEVFNRDYYALNIKPNRNQNSTRFYQDLIWKLYTNNEALIIQPKGFNGELFVADSFNKKVLALKDWIFTDVEVNDFTFREPLYMQDVMYFQLANENIKKLLDGMYASYGKLITTGLKSYGINRGRKGIVNFNGNIIGDNPQQKQSLDMLMSRFKTLFEQENGIAILEKGYSWQDLSTAMKDTESSRDIRQQVNDIYDMTAAAMSVSGALIRGDVAGLDQAVDFTLTFCIEPLIDLVETEINAKFYSEKDYLAGTRVIADTSMIKHLELSELSQIVYNLITTGTYSVDELRRKLREPEIGEVWSKEHFMLLAAGKADKASTNLSAERTENEK